MNLPVLLACVAVCLTASCIADPVAGTGVESELRAEGNGFKGNIQPNNAAFPLTAAVAVAATKNPLDTTTGTETRHEEANDAAQPTPTSALPGGFAELGVTATGRALTARFATAKSVDEAIQRTGDALGKLFDAKPQFDKAAVDSRTKNRGVASFSATSKGKEIRGIVMFSIDVQSGASVNLVYSRPDAPATEVGTLMATLPVNVPMKTYRFPDGSGSVDLPRGWIVEGLSATEAIVIRGPEGQAILNNIQMPIAMPTGSIMTMYQENVRRMRQFGARQLPPPPTGNFYAYASPEESLKTVLPDIHEKNKKARKDYTEFGEIISAAKAEPNPFIPNAEAGVFYFRSVKHKNGQAIPHLEMHRIDTFRTGEGKDFWNLCLNAFYAPEPIFQRDLPLMKDIIATFRLDPDAMRQKGIRDQKQIDALLADGQRQHENMLARGRQYQQDQNEHFNRMQANDQARRQARHDANSDFIEMIGGYRTVYNTATGTSQSVNYYQVNEITNAWNAASNNPNQYVQIPLRYQR